MEVPGEADRTWGIGFLTDVPENKRRSRSFDVIDDFDREVLHIEVDFSLTSDRVVRVLNHLVGRKGKPKKIRMDNGPGLIANLTRDCSGMHGIGFKYIQPGKPTQNAFVERFNGSYRRWVLDKYIFEGLGQVRERTRIWMGDYNNFRPHDGLDGIPPVEYALRKRAAAAGPISK